MSMWSTQGHVKVASIWSAGACCRFLGGQLAARRERASEQARRKRQQAAALQIRPDRHYPVILQLWDFDVPLVEYGAGNFPINGHTLQWGGAYNAFYVPNQRRGLVEQPGDCIWRSWRFHALVNSSVLAMASVAVATGRERSQRDGWDAHI